MFSSVFDRFSSIIGTGVRPTYSSFRQKEIKLTNQIALTVSVAGGPYFVVFKYLGYDVISYLVIPFVSLFGFSVILNHFSRYLLAKINIVLATSFAIYIYSSILTRDAGVQIVCFGIAAGSLVMFHSNGPAYRALAFFVPLIPLGLLELNHYSLPFQVGPYVFSPFLISATYLVSIVTTAITIFLTVLVYISLNEEAENRLHHINNQLEVALEEAKKRRITLEKLSQQAAFTRMAMGITHEIKNPMAALLTRAEIIEEKPNISSDVKTFVDMIKRNVDRITNIMDALLRYGKTDNKQFAHTPIGDTLNDALYLSEGKCQQKGIHLNAEFDNTIALPGNPTRLHQLFLNVLLNSIESCGKGDTITLSMVKASFKNKQQQVCNGICVGIRDTGSGMDSETLEKVFDPFFTTKYDNTGLGMSVSLKVIDEHNGMIDVTSTPGIGTSVFIYLPF